MKCSSLAHGLEVFAESRFARNLFSGVAPVKIFFRNFKNITDQTLTPSIPMAVYRADGVDGPQEMERN